MSRIGKQPVAIPSGVSVEIEGRDVRVKGPKGQVGRRLPAEISARVDDGRVGVLRGIVLGAGSTQEELVVPVALGAKILTRTVAPLRSSPERLGIEWEGVLVWSWWGGEPRMNVLVPPGEIRVSWWALEDGVERLVHEERRRVGAGEEASVEYVAPE